MDSPKLTVLSQSKCYNGSVFSLQHASTVLKCDMAFNVFLPRSASLMTPDMHKVPALVCLSGLTCNHDTFITKSGACQYSDQFNLALVCPDTSPRNVNCGLDSESWDFGQGASYYVDATTDEYKHNYQMYSYISKELLGLITSELPIDASRLSITGHSVGGHGALIIGAKNPHLFRSISAFAPMSDPTNSPWGIKAFTRFLGPQSAAWHEYSAIHLAMAYQGAKPLNVWIDQGSTDKFLAEHLLTPNLVNAMKSNPNINLTYRLQDGYDHGYWFIQSFVGDHIKWHASFLL